jgi:hypothetical protein
VGDLSTRGISVGTTEALGNAGHKADVTDADGNVISWIQVATGN